jgi:hypothetical protein
MSEQEGPGPGPRPATERPNGRGLIGVASAHGGSDVAALYERISVEVGRLYEGQLAAKDAELGGQRETIAALLRRAEAAEAERDRLRRARAIVAGERAEEARVAEVEREAQSGEIAALTARADEAEGFRDRLHDAAVRRYPHGPGTARTTAAPDAAATQEADGLWARLGRWWRQG